MQRDKSESVAKHHRPVSQISKNTSLQELAEHALPYFIDWLIENVHLVEITAFSDEDAYTIFETMNDRGFSLTPTEMLKGLSSQTSLTRPAGSRPTRFGETGYA